MLDHPSLFLSSSEWEDLRDKLADPFFEALHRNNLQAIDLLDQEKAHGDLGKVPRFLGVTGSPLHEIRGRIFKNRVIRGTVAWYLTKKEEYLQFALVSLEAACQSDDWSPRPGTLHGIQGASLDTSDLLYTVAFGYDSLYPYLSEDFRETCRSTLRDKGLAAYLLGLELKDWWENCNFNWGAALHGCAGFAALALRKSDPDYSSRVLEEVKPRLKTVIDYFYSGGGYPEGLMYLSTTLVHLSDFVMPLHRLTGEDLGLLTNPVFADVLSSFPYLVGGDGRPLNFSSINESSVEQGSSSIFWWARQLNRPDWAYTQEKMQRDWRDTHGMTFDVEAFWFREPFQAKAAPNTDGLHHFTGLDWLTWKGEKSWLGFRSGFNGDNHNHRDLGHFILGYGQERFLVDPGYAPRETPQHNAVTIRGHGQTDCSRAITREVVADATGFGLNCDLSACFPFSLRSFNRHLRLMEDRHLLVIDDIMGQAQTRNGARWHLQTRFPWRRDERGTLFIQGPLHTLAIHFLSETGYFQATDWNSDGPITTLSWTENYDRVESVHALLLSFGTPEITHRWEGKTLTVSIDGRIVIYDGERIGDQKSAAGKS